MFFGRQFYQGIKFEEYLDKSLILCDINRCLLKTGLDRGAFEKINRIKGNSYHQGVVFYFVKIWVIIEEEKANELIKFMIEFGKKYLAKVIWVTDGDTLLLEVNGEQFKSRARYIDCPETQKTHSATEFDLTIRDRVMQHWQWGKTATNFLKSLVEGKEITIITVEKDAFDRVVCDWYFGKSIAQSKNIQLKLSEEGLCTHFLPLQQYHFPPRELNLILGIFKKSAISASKKIGFWNEKDFLRPAEYKKLTKVT